MRGAGRAFGGGFGFHGYLADTVRAAAESQVHLMGIRAIRRIILEQEVQPDRNLSETVARAADALLRLNAYERKALSRRNRLLRRRQG